MCKLAIKHELDPGINLDYYSGRKVKRKNKHDFLLLVKQEVPRQWPLKLSDLTQGETVVKVVVGSEDDIECVYIKYKGYSHWLIIQHTAWFVIFSFISDNVEL